MPHLDQYNLCMIFNVLSCGGSVYLAEIDVPFFYLKFAVTSFLSEVCRDLIGNAWASIRLIRTVCHVYKL
jgi:hypothetical protein